MAAKPCLDSMMAMVSTSLRFSRIYNCSMRPLLASHSCPVCSRELSLSTTAGVLPGSRGARVGSWDMATQPAGCRSAGKRESMRPEAGSCAWIGPAWLASWPWLVWSNQGGRRTRCLYDRLHRLTETFLGSQLRLATKLRIVVELLVNKSNHRFKSLQMFTNAELFLKVLIFSKPKRLTIV